jgi:hypothetical protein
VARVANGPAVLHRQFAQSATIAGGQRLENFTLLTPGRAPEA